MPFNFIGGLVTTALAYGFRWGSALAFVVALILGFALGVEWIKGLLP